MTEQLLRGSTTSLIAKTDASRSKVPDPEALSSNCSHPIAGRSSDLSSLLDLGDYELL